MDCTGSDFVKGTIVPTPFRGLRVLLVDNDVTALLDIALVLETQFYKVTTTELATTALAMLHEGTNQFDLIMADVNMPEMGIFAFLKCIKLLRDMPIILMSNAEDKDMALKAKAEGVCFFFQKPISTEQLKNIWQHVNRKRRHLREKAKNQDTKRSFGMENDHEIGTTEDGNRGPIADHRRPKSKQIESDHVGIVKVKCVGQSSELAGGSKRKKEGNTFEEKGKCQRGGNSSIERNERGTDRENELGRTEGKVGSSDKKWRMKWTPDLHSKFTEVISVLGEKACPKRVTQMMNVPHMTHRHVANHLQKYRVQLKQAREALASFANQEGNENGFSQSQNQNNTMQFRRQDVHTLENANASGTWSPQFGPPLYNASSSGHVSRPMKVPHRNEDHEFANISSNISAIEKYMKLFGSPPTGNYSI